MFETLTGKKLTRFLMACGNAASYQQRMWMLPCGKCAWRCEADVHYTVVKEFIARVRERAVGAEVFEGAKPGPAGH